MREIGRIQRLQVQVTSLKIGVKPDRIYDPAGVVVVPALRLAARGAVGLLDERELLDVHHGDHPQSKYKQGNAVSFNFTGHYDRMRRRFGPSLAIGCAGENILIECSENFEVEALSRGLLIETAEGLQGRLIEVKVAHPCVAFSRFALNMTEKPSEAMTKETLQFLEAGARGFYCGWAGEPIVLRPGDRVLV